MILAACLAGRGLRGRARPRADGGIDYYRIDEGIVSGEPFVRIDLEDEPNTRPLRFTADGKTLFWLDSRGRDTCVLVAQSVATGELSVIGHDPRADVSGVLFDAVGGAVQAYSANYLTTEWVALDDAVKADLDFLRSALADEITIDSRSDSGDLWVVSVDPVTSPQAAYLFERTSRRLEQLYVTMPELQGVPLAAMHMSSSPMKVTALRDQKTTSPSSPSWNISSKPAWAAEPSPWAKPSRAPR